MISRSNVNAICRNREQIENYDKAIVDTTQMWDCHHRLETHFSDGTPRPNNAHLSKTELIALGMYWDRPAEELIFLTKSDHYKLHGKAKYKGAKWKSTKHLQKCWNEYTNLYMCILYKAGEHNRRSLATKGRIFSDMSKAKMSLAKKGKIKIQSNEEKQRRKETFKKLSFMYKTDNEGLTWNEFQAKYKGRIL